MSVNEKMTAIADAIREKTGGTDKLTLTDMAKAVTDVFAAGEEARQALIDKDVYIAKFNGNGQTDIKLQLPFAPDAVYIFSFDAQLYWGDGAYLALQFDRRAFSRMGGANRFVVNGSLGGQGITRASVHTVISFADNVFSYTAPVDFNAIYKQIIWPLDVEYKVVALNYTGGKSDEEILRGTVESIDDTLGGTYAFSMLRVNETLTEDQWAALIATKPNSTFTLV